jgi:hypothetical protein
MTYFRLVLLAVILLLAISCEKEAAELPFDIIPQIGLLEVKTQEVVEFKDTLEIRISYQDGDGDLGNPDPDIPSLIVKDARLAKPDSFHLQPLAPVGSNVSIQGELLVQLPVLFILGNGSTETTNFKIKLIDRMGHESNEIQTPNIKILR